MTIIIANQIDLVQAGRLADLAWKEYESSIGQPALCEPQLRRALLWLAWQACRIEREAQEAIRKLAVEEEREACAEIAAKAARRDARHMDMGEPVGLTAEGMRSWEIVREIRARSAKEVEKQ